MIKPNAGGVGLALEVLKSIQHLRFKASCCMVLIYLRSDIMDINKEINIALSLIQIAIEEDKSPWLQMNMNWNGNTNLRDIIEFNDQLRGCEYKTTYEIYGDEDRIPHVVATFTKLQGE